MLIDGLISCGARFRAWLKSLTLEGDIIAIDAELGVLEAAARKAREAAKWL
jgi:hypothetical protein